MTYVDICKHGDRATECIQCRPFDPVLADLLDRVEALYRRYVLMGDDAFALVTTWTVHVYAFTAFEFTPYLAITSAVKRSGKSQLLEVIELVLGGTRSISTANSPRRPCTG